MNVAIYCRVSKDEKYKDQRYQDPGNQQRIIEEYCKAKGHTIVGVYIDRQSGADPNRPEFKKVIDARHAYALAYKAIIVWKLDRFSREPMNVILGYINRLKANGIGLISVTETWLDTRDDNPVTELILAIMAWFCSEERRKISERTKAGIAKRKEDGTYTGGRPKGAKDKKYRRKKGYYLRDYNKLRGGPKTPHGIYKGNGF